MIAENETVSLTFMAFAMSMDAFSVSLGLGMQKLRLKRIAMIGFVFGIFHVLFPLIGMIVGKLLSGKVGDLATLVGGLLLVAIGSQMFFTAFTHGSNHEMRKVIRPVGFGLIILAMTVSMDSFSVGLSLGISGVQAVFALLLFSVTVACLTWIGLFLGRKARGFLGVYSEILGGSILIAFGLKMLFS